MPQATVLIDVIKKGLRERGLTYARVAEALGLSESSVKRVFSQENLSLDRLEQICAVMDLEITDLFDLTRAAEKRITELTEEQEEVLVSDPKVLLIAILAINHWTVPFILEKYRFSESELVALLVRLDRLGIIELLPGNRIKVRLAHNFSWRKGGPIQRFFESRVQEQFFKSSFLGKGELRITLQGALSAKSNELLQQRMRKIAEEFDSLVGEDRSLDHAMREGMTMVMAIRPWELGLFAELRRAPARPNPSPRAQEK